MVNSFTTIFILKLMHLKSEFTSLLNPYYYACHYFEDSLIQKINIFKLSDFKVVGYLLFYIYFIRLEYLFYLIFLIYLE